MLWLVAAGLCGERVVWGSPSCSRLLAGPLPGRPLDGSSLLVLFEAPGDSAGDRLM